MDRPSACPLEEYRIICAMRCSYALLRFDPMALLLHVFFVCVWLTSVFLRVGGR